jgi:XTP/dITP diphosphohydrolase
LASYNSNKYHEISALLHPAINLVTLEAIGFSEKLNEDFLTYHDNALQKALAVYRQTKLNILAEDSGLEVRALGNQPGVHSARYSGPQSSDVENVSLLLKNLEEKKDRHAVFITVLCLIWNGRQHFFEGKCEGRIPAEPRGSNGFGFDPVFIPVGSSQTFGEMNLEEKNRYSHRNRAVTRLNEWFMRNAL